MPEPTIQPVDTAGHLITFEGLHAEYLREIASKVRAEQEAEQLLAAVEAARGVMNCLAEDDTYVAMHDSPGSCLDILRRAIEAIDKPARRRRIAK